MEIAERSGAVDRADSVLWMKMMQIETRVEIVLKEDLGVSWFKPSMEDKLRLLTLEGWEEKYRVSLNWILVQLVPFWRKRFVSYRKVGGKSLGVSVATLVGKKSEEILKQKLSEQFPDGENLARWRVREQARQWDISWDQPIRVEDWEHPQETILRYQRRMVAERRERKSWVAKRKRRRYRDNPWVG